jgi:hypothetical protein
MPGEPDGRQDVHNRGVDVQMAAVNLCGQTDLPTGRMRHQTGPSRRTCEFVSKGPHEESPRLLPAAAVSCAWIIPFSSVLSSPPVPEAIMGVGHD